MLDRKPNRRIFLGVYGTFILAVLAGGCTRRDPRRGLRLLQEKRAKMRAGMTIAEIDALMAGHPRRADTGSYDFADDRAMPNPSALAVDYGDHVGATEGDYGLTAFFDKDGKLMDTSIGEYLK